jgi:hypothetical protein
MSGTKWHLDEAFVPCPADGIRHVGLWVSAVRAQYSVGLALKLGTGLGFRPAVRNRHQKLRSYLPRKLTLLNRQALSISSSQPMSRRNKRAKQYPTAHA